MTTQEVYNSKVKMTTQEVYNPKVILPVCSLNKNILEIVERDESW
jgi:hypothetical protein